MLSYLRHGWQLGGITLAFLLRNRGLQRFVLAAMLLAALAAAAVGGTAAVMRNRFSVAIGVAAAAAASYAFGVIGTAASVGLAGLVADALDGRSVLPSAGWRLIVQRRRAIMAWGVLQFVVGLPARVAGSWAIDQLFVILLGFGWALLSFFAIPVIALSGTSALSSGRHALRLVRQRWGGAVYGTVYVWVRTAVTIGVPGALLVGLGALCIAENLEVVGAIFVGAGAATLAAAYLLSLAARSVIAVVLYRYIESGWTSPSFSSELLEGALRPPAGLVERLARRFEGSRVRHLRRRLLGDDEAP